jgi:DNA-binding MarR family transcriptional regulator
MQQLKHANKKNTPAVCARDLLMTVPAVMKFVRSHMGGSSKGEVSVPQFRTLIFLTKNKDASLSMLAEHLALSVSATSRLIDGLVRRGIVHREISMKDRRQVHLSLTTKGETIFHSARNAAVEAMVDSFSELTERELARIAEATALLMRIFGYSEAFR